MAYRVRKRNIDETPRTVERLEDLLTDTLLRRFHLRAGFTTTSVRTLEHTRHYLCDFLERLLDAVVVLMGHHNRRTILLTDVLRACRHYGIRLYGYDDMCVLEGPWGIAEYHITEMVEVDSTFNRARDEDEPDHEPSAHYKRTDFVQNQQAWDADDEEDEDSGDDSEWSWYSDSDADSECDVEEEFDFSSTTSASRWRKNEDPRETFLQSLQAAQAVVDNELLAEPESVAMEWDTPLGQGYESDCDSSRLTIPHEDWQKSAQAEEAKWEVNSTTAEYIESESEGVSDAMEDEDHVFHEDLGQYVISRQTFKDILYAALCGILNCSYPISSVALSALHNVSEQCLQAALTSGTLRAQVVSTLMEEQLEAAMNERAELEAERQKVKDIEAAMVEMQTSFHLKEQEMLRQIAELERKVYEQHQEGIVDVDMEIKPRTSPGKRKASSNYDLPVTKEKQQTTSTSIVGALRSRLHEYSLRKKAKISPV